MTITVREEGNAPDVFGTVEITKETITAQEARDLAISILEAASVAQDDGHNQPFYFTPDFDDDTGLPVIVGDEWGYIGQSTVLRVMSPTRALIGCDMGCRAVYSPRSLCWTEDEIPPGCVKTLEEAKAAFAKAAAA